MLTLFRSSRSIIAVSTFVAASLFAADTVEIRPGDTLSELAVAHDVALADLMEWNDLEDRDRIVAGRTLIVSPPDTGGIAEQYVVQPGETLSEIALRLGASTRGLAEANAITDPDRVFAGQTLRIGGGGGSSTPTPPTTPTTYTVAPGDTLSEIAEDHGVSTRALAEANDVSNRNLIRIGQTLTIPAGGRPAPADPPSTPPTTTTPTPADPPSTPPTTAPTPAAPPTTTTPAPPTTPGTPSCAPLAPLFTRWSVAYGVPQDLLEAITWKESDWRPDAVGPAGHLGIGQLSPSTAAFVEERLLGLDLDPLAASDGIQLAARYLRYLLDRTDAEREAVAAWNQGLADVRNTGISAAGNVYADAVLSIRASRS